jgi:hypothetical protein
MSPDRVFVVRSAPTFARSLTSTRPGLEEGKLIVSDMWVLLEDKRGSICYWNQSSASAGHETAMMSSSSLSGVGGIGGGQEACNGL